MAFYRAGKKKASIELPGCYLVMAYIHDVHGKAMLTRVGRAYKRVTPAMKMCAKYPRGWVEDYNTKRPLFCVGFPKGLESVINHQRMAA